jgi:hypothetical protein
MRFLTTKGIVASPMNALQTSGPITAEQLFSTSGQFIVTGVTTATGFMKLQASNDPVFAYNNGVPTNWNDITSIPLNGNGVYLISKVDLCYRFIRFAYVPTINDAGATVECNAQALGV